MDWARVAGAESVAVVGVAASRGTLNERCNAIPLARCGKSERTKRHINLGFNAHLAPPLIPLKRNDVSVDEPITVGLLAEHLYGIPASALRYQSIVL